MARIRTTKPSFWGSGCPRDKAHEWTEHDYRLRVANWHHDATA